MIALKSFLDRRQRMIEAGKPIPDDYDNNTLEGYKRRGLIGAPEKKPVLPDENKSNDSDQQNHGHDTNPDDAYDNPNTDDVDPEVPKNADHETDEGEDGNNGDQDDNSSSKKTAKKTTKKKTSKKGRNK